LEIKTFVLAQEEVEKLFKIVMSAYMKNAPEILTGEFEIND